MTTTKETTRPQSDAYMVIAVVDDDAAVRFALEDLIESSGMTCLTFASAEICLERLHEVHVDCLVLDLDLPGRSGLELLGELTRKGITIPAIFLSAHDQPFWRLRAMEQGAIAYLVKPVNAEQVLRAIRQCIGT